MTQAIHNWSKRLINNEATIIYHFYKHSHVGIFGRIVDKGEIGYLLSLPPKPTKSMSQLGSTISTKPSMRAASDSI